MLNRFFLSGALQVLFVSIGLLILVVSPKNAQSQQCDAPFETITRFDKPDPGAAMVWQTFYNQYGTVARERQTRFVSSYGLDNGDVLIVGQVQLMKNVRPSLILVQFNDRGRAEWEKIHSMPHMKDIVKIVPDGEGSAVLVNMETPKGYRYFWIGFFDKKGGLKSSQTIKDKQFEMLANDIHPSIDDKGWAVPVTVLRKWGGDPTQSQKNAAIYILNKDGKRTEMRSYILGVRTELMHVVPQDFEGESKGYIATGYFENDSQKRIAWVMRLNPDLSMVWQKEFGRGISAKLVNSVDDKNGDVLIIGDVNSAESDIKGAWLAKLDGVYGNILWQRYYASKKGDYSYNARNVVQHDDGRISFLMLGKVFDKKKHKRKYKKKRDDETNKSGVKEERFGHLLTLSPRGLIMSGDAYYAGFGSYVSSMSTDSLGRLVLVGNSWQKSYAEIKRQREKNMPEVVPLRDDGEIHLPDVQLSDKTRQGLALLKKKISAQDVIEEKHSEEPHKKKEVESAKSSDELPELLQKGWVFTPELDNTYKDPCR